MAKVYINNEESGYYKSRELYTIEVPSAEEAKRIQDAYNEASWCDKSNFLDEGYLKDNFNITSYEYEEIDIDKEPSDCNFYLKVKE